MKLIHFSFLLILSTSAVKCDLLDGVLKAQVLVDLGYTPSATYINLDNLGITEIEANTFALYVNLKWLHLSHNKIKTIPVGLFNGLSALLLVDLSYNCLEDLSLNLFHGLNNLNFLILHHNQIQTISRSALLGCETSCNLTTSVSLPALVYLDLSHNDLKLIRVSDFVGLGSLTRLFLNNNKIVWIDGAFDNLTLLVYLNLSNNCLFRIVSGLFANLELLDSLDLSHNKIEFIETDAFIGLIRLKLLDLSFNLIVKLCVGLFDPLINLRILLLSNNCITIIENCVFDKLLLLTELNLSNNRIEELIPHLLDVLVNLEKLNLEVNLLSVIQAVSLNPLVKLKVLDLSCNRINFIEWDLLFLQALEWVSLRSNLIAEISLCTDSTAGTAACPDFLGPYGPPLPLVYVDISCNHLVSLNKYDFYLFANLETLILSNNEISLIDPLTFSLLVNLKLLDLSHNLLSAWTSQPFLSVSILSFTLEQLILAHNRICYISDDAFILLVKLKILNIKANLLIHLGLALNGLKNLEILDMSSNLIAEITSNTLAGSTALVSVNLESNQIHLIDSLALSWIVNLMDILQVCLFSNPITIESPSIFSPYVPCSTEHCIVSPYDKCEPINVYKHKPCLCSNSCKDKCDNDLW